MWFGSAGKAEAHILYTTLFPWCPLLGLSEFFHSPLANVLDHLHSFLCAEWISKKTSSLGTLLSGG